MNFGNIVAHVDQNAMQYCPFKIDVYANKNANLLGTSAKMSCNLCRLIYITKIFAGQNQKYPPMLKF